MQEVWDAKICKRKTEEGRYNLLFRRRKLQTPKILCQQHQWRIFLQCHHEHQGEIDQGTRKYAYLNVRRGQNQSWTYAVRHLRDAIHQNDQIVVGDHCRLRTTGNSCGLTPVLADDLHDCDDDDKQSGDDFCTSIIERDEIQIKIDKQTKANAGTRSTI